MRKFNFLIAAFIAGAAFFTGCATADKRVIFQESPIALVSIVANSDINWKGEAPYDVSKATRSARRNMEADPDLAMVTSSVDYIDEIEELIRNYFESSGQISFAPKNTVFDSRSYNEAVPNRYHVSDNLVKPSGYNYIFYRDNNFFSGLAAETGITKSLFITLDLTKDFTSGISKTGSFRVVVSMSVLLKDEKGKTLFSKTYEERSIDSAKVSLGQYSQSDMRRLLFSAIGEACNTFLDDIAY